MSNQVETIANNIFRRLTPPEQYYINKLLFQVILLVILVVIVVLVLSIRFRKKNIERLEAIDTLGDTLGFEDLMNLDVE